MIKIKYLLVLIPFMLCSCASIKYVTVDHGQLVTENSKHVEILGNPPLDCMYNDSDEIFSGYFMYQEDDGTILLDAFGTGILRLDGSPICTFSRGE